MTIPHYQEIADLRREEDRSSLGRMAEHFEALEPPEPPHVIRAQQRRQRGLYVYLGVCGFVVILLATVLHAETLRGVKNTVRTYHQLEQSQ